jgi:hypothetical protein
MALVAQLDKADFKQVSALILTKILGVWWKPLIHENMFSVNF